MTREKQPHRRGFKFQDFLSKIFSEARFEVHANPKTAQPRQSDLFVSHEGENYLIEAKWQKKKITSSDIDSLRSRLERVTPDVIGCLFSMSDYTSEAVNEVQSHRQRMILVFSSNEVQRLARGEEKVLDLIKRKRKSLLIDGKVWLSTLTSPPPKSAHFPQSLPRSSFTIVQCKSKTDCIAIRNTDNHDALFAPYIPEVAWGPLGGYGVGVEIRVNIHNLSGLKHFLTTIHDQLGLTTEGSFSIRQLQCSWHGFGLQNFFQQITRKRDRYQKAKLSYIHHSEDLHYFDACHTGFMSLTCRQSIRKDNAPLDMATLQLQLAGIPADMRPFLRVFEEAGDKMPHFVPFLEHNLDSARLSKPIKLQPPVARILSNHLLDKSSVCGIVVPNPFKNKKRIPAGKLKYSPFGSIYSPEYLICRLRDWHDASSIVDYYYLTDVEGISVGQAGVYSCAATWNAILNPRFPQATDTKPIPSIMGFLSEEARKKA